MGALGLKISLQVSALYRIKFRQKRRTACYPSILCLSSAVMSDMGYSIKVVARLTGLTAHVIRIWEKRYAAVTPGRTPTNRRLYSDVEIERLNLLRLATEAGHSIRNVASLPTEALRSLVGAGAESSATASASRQRAKPSAASQRSASAGTG